MRICFEKMAAPQYNLKFFYFIGIDGEIKISPDFVARLRKHLFKWLLSANLKKVGLISVFGPIFDKKVWILKNLAKIVAKKLGSNNSATLLYL